jgi:hypothetical protein
MTNGKVLATPARESFHAIPKKKSLARMERSEIRERRSGLNAAPGFRYAPSELHLLQNLIIVLRVSVTLLVMPTGPPLARWNAAYCS